MIKVEYHRSFHKVTIEGHALSGEKGHDLVCAAASILAYTLAASVSNMQEHGHLNDSDVELNEGKAVIKCRPQTQFKAVVAIIFDNICGGFELLSRDYPDNISYKIVI